MQHLHKTEGGGPTRSYHYTGTLPQLISFVCHSYKNTGGVWVFFPFWNGGAELLFVAQRDHGIDAHRSSRGDATRRGGDARKNDRYGDKRQRIVWGNLVELCRKRSARTEGAKHSYGDANRRQFQSLADDHTHNLRRTCAQRRPNADFVGALRDQMRHHAVDPDRSQKHGQRSEENHQLGHHAVARILYDHQRFERLNRRNRLVAVHGPYGVADGCGHGCGIASRAHHESKRPGWKLRQGNVHLPLGALPQFVHFDVVYHAHNLADGMTLTKLKSLFDGIFIGPKLPREGLIDNHRL